MRLKRPNQAQRILGLLQAEPDCWHNAAGIAHVTGIKVSSVKRALRLLHSQMAVEWGPSPYRGPQSVKNERIWMAGSNV